MEIIMCFSFTMTESRSIRCATRIWPPPMRDRMSLESLTIWHTSRAPEARIGIPITKGFLLSQKFTPATAPVKMTMDLCLWTAMSIWGRGQERRPMRKALNEGIKSVSLRQVITTAFPVFLKMEACVCLQRIIQRNPSGKD